jgi:hypothetical protein
MQARAATSAVAGSGVEISATALNTAVASPGLRPRKAPRHFKMPYPMESAAQNPFGFAGGFRVPISPLRGSHLKESEWKDAADAPPPGGFVGAWGGSSAHSSCGFAGYQWANTTKPQPQGPPPDPPRYAGGPRAVIITPFKLKRAAWQQGASVAEHIRGLLVHTAT